MNDISGGKLMLQSTPPDGDKNLSQSLCQLCGLCCDGTLFGHVGLQADDDVAALQDAGVVIVAKDDTRIFSQPCVCYENKSCAIYARRPHTCVTFKCRLLKKYEKNEVTRAEAFEIVDQAVRHRDRVRSQLQLPTAVNTGTINQMFQTWQQARGNVDRTAWRKEHAQTLLDYHALKYRLERFFGRSKPKVNAAEEGGAHTSRADRPHDTLVPSI